jgi:predicted DNA-binding transcriptional regulator AlpA
MNPARKLKRHTSTGQLAFAFADAPAQQLPRADEPAHEPLPTKPELAPPLTPVAPVVLRKRPPRPTKAVRANPEMTREDRRLTVDEAAALLSVSVKTLEAWRRLGKGPMFVKLGRSVRYTMRSLDEFTRDRTVRNSAEGRMLDVRR